MTPAGALQRISEQGFEGEVYVLECMRFRLEYSAMELRADAGYERGFGVRVLGGGRLGFGYSTHLETAVERALEIARCSAKAELEFAAPESYPEAKVYDRSVEALDVEQGRELLMQAVHACSEHATPTQASMSWACTRREVYNTSGVEAEQRSTEVGVHVMAVAGNASGIHFASARSLGKVSFAEVGRRAGWLAKSSKNASGAPERVESVVLKPVAVAELLEHVLVPAFSAENVQRGRSMLASKLGEQVFCENFSLYDDPTLPFSAGSCSFDDEGVATKRKALVERGVLRAYLHSLLTARRAGESSTGNAFRSSYASQPEIDATNLVVSGGGGAEEDGALVVHGLIGAHTANVVSGDFSLETRNAFYDGTPVRKAIIAGNVYEMLSTASFGSDAEEVAGVLTPSMRTESLRVTG
ncbi:MAG: TldD/PmbA family protein [Euryarchaeota archaeon]|nr:TldD/PmbA family protein [Euryarchaeota archaeon]